MTTGAPKDTVRRGYDLVSSTYRRSDFAFAGSGYAKYLAWLRPHLARGAKVLDIGCGCGVPVARELASAGCDVLGVDISEVQIGRARDLVPDAEFLRGDIMELSAAPSSFDIVVAFYSIIHLPREDHEPVLSRIAQWTKPGGVFLGTVGAEEAAGYLEADWLGVPGATMFWSHAPAEAYREWLSAAGFEILREDVLVESGGGRHPVILAGKADRN